MLRHRWCVLLAAVPLGLAVPAPSPAGIREGEIVLANDVLEVRLDAGSGAVLQVTDRRHDLRLCREEGVAPPFRLATPAGIRGAAGEVAARRDPDFDGTAWELDWSVEDEPALAVHARVELPPGEAPARFTVRVTNEGGPRIDWIEYPVFGGVGSLGEDPSRTELVHPVAGGYLVRDPLAHLHVDERFGFWPDAYGGAALQVMAYLEHGVGGFHFEVEDASGDAKRLGCHPDLGTGWLEIAFRRYSPDARPGVSLAPEGPVVLAASRTGTWEETGDRYREWALGQPWAARGPLRDLPDDRVARWLLEEVGVATFGISVRRDQAAWFSGLRDFLGVPLFHVSGYWWPGGVGENEWYGGYNDWDDDRVDPVNLEAIRAAGDRFALFLFPQHFSRDATEYDEPAPDPATDPVAPWAPYAMDPDPEDDPWSYMCAATPEWRDFYGWRAVTLVERHLPDAEYLDIGPALGRVHCEREEHGHPPGWGRHLVRGAQEMLDSRREELHRLRGAYVPRGTELMSEPWIDRFDFWQARAGGGPLGMLEGDLFRQGVIEGWAERIPLFTWVYHEVGPVRLDGNLKLAAELGELFHWVAARIVLEGGIPELNYELSALERLPGMTGPTFFETYRPDYDCMDVTPYDAAPDRAETLRELADLRTRRAPEFLVYGRMRRAPAFAGIVPQVSLDWHLYNTFARDFSCEGGIEHGEEYHSHGTLAVPAVLARGWSAPVAPPPGGVERTTHEQVGEVLAEVGGEARVVSLVLDPPAQGVPLLNFAVTVRRRDGDEDAGMRHPGDALQLSLAAREAVLVRLAPAACAGDGCHYRVWRGEDPGAVAGGEPIAEVTGHAWSDEEAAGDGRTWFYLVDDGGGYPVDSLRVTLSDSVDLAW